MSKIIGKKNLRLKVQETSFNPTEMLRGEFLLRIGGLQREV